MDGLGVRRAHRSSLMNFLQRKKFLGRFIYFAWFWEAPLIMHEDHNFARKSAKVYVFTNFGWSNWSDIAYYESTKSFSLSDHSIALSCHTLI